MLARARRPRLAPEPRYRPPKVLQESTESVFLQTLTQLLSQVNNAMKRCGSEGVLVIETRSQPWPGIAVIRTLPNGSSGLIQEPMNEEGLLLYLTGVLKGLDLRNPL